MKHYHCHSNKAYTKKLTLTSYRQSVTGMLMMLLLRPLSCGLQTADVLCLHDLLSPVHFYLVLARPLTVQDYGQIHLFLQPPPHTVTFQVPRVKTSTHKPVGRTTELISTGNIRLDKVAHTYILKPQEAETGGAKSLRPTCAIQQGLCQSELHNETLSWEENTTEEGKRAIKMPQMPAPTKLGSSNTCNASYKKSNIHSNAYLCRPWKHTLT